MADSIVGFDAEAFKTAIRFAIHMAAPQAVQDRVTFVWKPVRTNSTADQAGYAYDFGATPTSVTQHPPVQVDCAIAFHPSRLGGSDFTDVGEFDNERVVLTVLDEDYQPVSTATHVLIGGDSYFIEYHSPPIALFNVGVVDIYCMSDDKS